MTTTTITTSSTTTATQSTRSPTTTTIAGVTSDGAVLLLDDGSVYSVGSADQSTVSGWSEGDDVSVDDSSSTITDTSSVSPEAASVTYVGDENGDYSYSAGGDQSQQTSSSDGSIEVLDDGSIWIVDAADRSTTATWTDGDSVTVTEGQGGYELVNTSSQETVATNYVGTM